jgi:hypothetical protein
VSDGKFMTKNETFAAKKIPSVPLGMTASASGMAAFEERHYTVAEVAALWSLSKDAVRDIFRHEDGVLAIGTVSSRGRRGYVTLRIPASVLERVHQQMSLSKQYPKR